MAKKEKAIRTIDEINEKIQDGSVIVITAEEMEDIVKSKGVEAAAKEVDVVTSETYGAMCRSCLRIRCIFIKFHRSNF